MNENNSSALFDSIINSEDEMIKYAGLQNEKYKAYIYLRAYIMSTLCFTKQIVVTDTAITLNRAFRTLIDKSEGVGNYFSNEDKYLQYPDDFSWLIKEGHIGVAFRDNFSSFSELYRETMKDKKHVDLPSNDDYIKMIDAICPSKCIKRYSIKEASINFSNACRKQINKELNNINILPEREKFLKNFIYRLSDKEIFTYNNAKSILLDDMKLNEKDPEYESVRKILRQSYDYNIPTMLGLDYRISLKNIKPDKNHDWKLDLSYKKIKHDFICNVYGLAMLPARHLRDIWGSKEGIEFFQQLDMFEDETFDLNEYVEVLNNYLLRINVEIENNYGKKFIHESSVKKHEVEFRKYFKTDGKLFVVAKTASNIYTGVNYIRNFDSLILDTLFCKLIPNIGKRIDGFPNPPEEMKEAIIMKSKSEQDINGSI